MTKTLRPNGDRLLVVPVERDLKSEGILLPETSNEEQIVGIVAAVGTQVKGAFVPGQLVIFGRFAGIEVELSGKPFIVMKEEEILGAFEDSTDGEANS